MLVLPFSGALTWSRFRRPWRPARRLAREPGAVALLAVAVSVAMIVLDEVMMQTLPGPPGTRPLRFGWRPVIDPGAMLAVVPGPAVLAAWATQRLAGIWRPRAGWIDRAGIALGVLWVVLYLLRSWLLLHVPI